MQPGYEGGRERMNKRMTAAAAGLASVLTAGSVAGEPAKEVHGPGLVEIMMATQSHHAKLWLAGHARNWDLADYQIDELKEGLEDAAKHIPDYKGIPVGRMQGDYRFSFILPVRVEMFRKVPSLATAVTKVVGATD